MRIGTVVCLFLPIVFGCTQKSGKMLEVDNRRVTLATYPAQIRGTYFITQINKDPKIPSDTSVRFCAEPSPDVAMENIQKVIGALTAKLPNKTEVDANVNADLATKVVQLAGRTELVVLAREMLYRSCELTLNNSSPEAGNKAYDMYDRVAKLVENLSLTEKLKAESELVATRAKFAMEKSGECLERWTSDKDENPKVVEKWLKDKKLDVSITLFTYGSGYEKERTDFIAFQKISCD